jgi:hypothetical protein
VAQKLNLATPFSAGIAQVDAAANGRLSNALMLEHWAFAAEFTATTVSTEISVLFD